MADSFAEEPTRAPASFKPDTIFQQIEKEKHPEAPKEKSTPEASLPSDKAPAEGEDSYGISGNWNGKRKTLEDAGFAFSAIYKGDWVRNFKGGVRKQSSYFDNLDLKLLIDGEKVLGLKGWSFFLYGLGNSGADRGGRLSLAVGDNQVSDNIETTVDDFKLFEAWAQYLNEENHFSVLFGIHDLNSEFYVTDSSLLFINSSFGIGAELSATGVNGSSVFPYTAPAIRVRVEPTKRMYLMSAAFNAISGNPEFSNGSAFTLSGKNGVLFIHELGFTGTDESPYKIALGYWSYSKTFDSLETTPKPASSYGGYFLADKTINSWLSAFLRYGIASSETNLVRDNISAGLMLKGVVPHRPRDRLGLGVTRATPGAEFRALMDSSGTPLIGDETQWEVTYRIEVLKGLALQPDFQYVVHPGFDPSLSNAVVGGLRVEISL